jgi:hypothetical protein
MRSGAFHFNSSPGANDHVLFCTLECNPGVLPFSRAKEGQNMRWTPGGESQDVEDRRDESGGGGGGFQFGGMHIGIGGAILLLILSFVFRTNFFALLSGGGSASPSPAAVTKHDSTRDTAE